MGASSLIPGLMSSVWAAGSDAPEMTTVRVGFIPLTDCAPLVIAALKGFDKKYGITLVPTKEASWAAVRDKLVSESWMRLMFCTACCMDWNWGLPVKRSQWPI